MSDKCLDNELQAVLDSLPYYVIIVDSSHNILMANKAVYNQMGFSPEQVTGKYCPKVIHGLNAPYPGCPLEEAVHKGCSVEKEFYDTNYQRWFRSAIYSIGVKTKKGNHTYFHILQDITAQKNLEEENRKISEQFHQAQKMDALGQLACGIAHDFNNILTGIVGNSEILKLTTPPDSSTIKNIEQLLNLANSAKDLIHQLLVFSRKSNIETAPVNIDICIKKSIDILRHSINKNISIESEFSAVNTTVVANESQIENMFLNIGINARDAMPQGGIIKFKTSNIVTGNGYPVIDGLKGKNGEYICISITDTGKGMDEETKEHIFEPFFTTKAEGKGTGLGLAVVFSTVYQSGGIINVDSAPGNGTTFSLYLPVVNS